MANDIGGQRSTKGSSMALNTQKGAGAMKPSEKGNHSPGGTKPPANDSNRVELNK